MEQASIRKVAAGARQETRRSDRFPGPISLQHDNPSLAVVRIVVILRAQDIVGEGLTRHGEGKYIAGVSKSGSGRRTQRRKRETNGGSDAC